jgi:hypothetical protein
MKHFILGILLLAGAISASEHTGIIETDSGNLLRAGFISTNDWQVESNQTVKAGVPFPAKIYDIFSTNGWHCLSNTTWIICNPPMTNRMDDWNNSKTNYSEIVNWENASSFRLGQLNAIYTAAGLITNNLTFPEISPAIIADFTRQAGPTSPAVSVSIALEECVKFTEEWTVELIGFPPDRSPISKHITSHP